MCFLHYKKLMRGNKGWSLVEVMIGTAILVIALLPLMNLINGLLKGVQNRKKEFNVTIIAEDLMENIKQKRWDEGSTDPQTYLLARNRSVNLGPDKSERFPYFDDIDDFNGYTYRVGYITCKVTVKYVDVNLDAPVTDSNIPTDFKKITIIANTGDAQNKNIVITTILENSGKPAPPSFEGYSLYYLARYYSGYGFAPWVPLVDNNLVIATEPAIIYSTIQGNWTPTDTIIDTSILPLTINVIGEKTNGGKDPRTGFSVKYRVWNDKKVGVKTKMWGEKGGIWWFRGSGWGSVSYLVRMDRYDTFQRQSDTVILINGSPQTIAIGASFEMQRIVWWPGDNGSGYCFIRIENLDPEYFGIHQEVWEYDEEWDSAHVRIKSFIENLN